MTVNVYVQMPIKRLKGEAFSEILFGSILLFLFVSKGLFDTAPSSK